MPMLLGENEGTLTFWHQDLEFTASTRLTALYVAIYERPYVSDEFLKLSDWDYPLSAALEDEEEVFRSWSD